MSRTRKVEKQIRISAPAGAVWNALTDAEELMRWFPLDARVDPGEGGSIWYSWGPPFEGENSIDVWDPPRQLRLRDRAIGSHREKENPKGATSDLSENAEPKLQLAIEFTIDTEGGGTVLRLVHSGFGVDADWDEEYEGVSRGWDTELLGLKHYLERHAGQPRRAVWARTRVEASRDDVWNRLTNASAFNVDGLAEGESFERLTGDGDLLKGTVVLNRKPTDFCAILHNWNDAFFRLSIEQSSRPRLHAEPNVWLSTYGLMNHVVLSTQSRWTRLTARIFPDEFNG